VKRKTTDMKQLFAEVLEYEQKRDKMNQCGRSTVQAVNCIMLNEIQHAGVVAHICKLQSGHVGDCQCCGYHWKGEK